MELKGLYRQIIRLHQKLPVDLRIIGDRYAQAEFKSFIKANNESYWPAFKSEWQRYLQILSHQLPDDKAKREPETLVLGASLEQDYVLNAEQQANLERLKKEASPK